MQHDMKMGALLRHAKIADAFATWLRDNGEDLIDAVDLVGGRRWVTRATQLVTSAQQGDLVNRLTELRAIHRLLYLDFASRSGSCEEARLAAIHPDHPRADNARICAEAIAHGMQAIAALDRARVNPMQEVT